MTFLWPEALWLLAALPLLVALYVFVLRRKKKLALRYAGLSLIRDSVGAGQSARRHVPPALFLAALAGMLLAGARPAALVTLPSQHETVILAMDVSGSMRAEDVKPSRLAASQAAAKAFVAGTPRSTRIGVVAFAGSASLVQPPTHNRADIVAALEQFQLQHATAVGSGILASLKAIFPDLDFDPFNFRPRSAAAGGSAPPARPGSYRSAAIILLTDGQTTTGPDPVEAARVAAGRGVRVFTVGVGTPQGEILTGEGWSIRVRLDEQALKQIADMTRGEYFHAGSALDLKKVYASLNARLVMEKKETEITALFAVAAALLALASAALSLLWFNRIL
ncbi:MAG: ABC transporter ATP-binding protein [Betaproteobacteria bacterium RIFCSPLOWO2_12_FULL_68_19]|nr:MAG: ABC transporter ATP-binding protein [Betaproteobacteria bacterium RIFCSPLOWO2_12_FULL_68_19]